MWLLVAVRVPSPLTCSVTRLKGVSLFGGISLVICEGAFGELHS